MAKYYITAKIYRESGQANAQDEVMAAGTAPVLLGIKNAGMDNATRTLSSGNFMPLLDELNKALDLVPRSWWAEPDDMEHAELWNAIRELQRRQEG